MSATAAGAKPDLFTLMNAYAVLEVAYSASPFEIRASYRRLAAHCHPDIQPADSPAQRDATARMAAINDAYALVRDAPLRHHPVSRGSDRDVTWDDAELDDAISRARAGRLVLDLTGALLCGVFGVLIALPVASTLMVLGLPGYAGYAVAIPLAFGIAGVLCGRRFLAYWYAIDLFLAILRLVYR